MRAAHRSAVLDGAYACRGCGVLLVWRFTARGKIIPLTATQLLVYEDGCYVVEGDYCRPALPLFDAGPYLRPHWADCAEADAFRASA